MLTFIGISYAGAYYLSRERREEYSGENWIELQSYIAALRAERHELREALEEIANGRYGKSVAVKNIARAVLAMFLPLTTARLIVGYIGVAVGFLFIGLDLTGGFGFGLLIGMLLILVASQEIQAARAGRF